VNCRHNQFLEAVRLILSPARGSLVIWEVARLEDVHPSSGRESRTGQ